jgi:hypothetical protein
MNKQVQLKDLKGREKFEMFGKDRRMILKVVLEK